MAPKLKFHEGLALDAVIRRIEQREQRHRADVRFHDRDTTIAPVELTCQIGDDLFAFEHTGIEPFARHLELEAKAELYLKPIERDARLVLPPDARFQFHIPVTAFHDRRGADVRRIQKAIGSWIEQAARSITIAPPGRRAEPILAEPSSEIPFPVSLYGWEAGGLPEHFAIVSYVPDDLEGARSERLGAGYLRKAPKLASWKRDRGARTVLILEENDIFLTNHVLIADAVEYLEQDDLMNAPDEIWLVSTAIDKSWCVWWLRVGERRCEDLSYWGASLGEIDPATLTNLTGR